MRLRFYPEAISVLELASIAGAVVQGPNGCDSEDVAIEQSLRTPRGERGLRRLIAEMEEEDRADE